MIYVFSVVTLLTSDIPVHGLGSSSVHYINGFSVECSLAPQRCRTAWLLCDFQSLLPPGSHSSGTAARGRVTASVVMRRGANPGRSRIDS